LPAQALFSATEQFILVAVEELDIPDIDTFQFKYNILELNTAAKPYDAASKGRAAARPASPTPFSDLKWPNPSKRLGILSQTSLTPVA